MTTSGLLLHLGYTKPYLMSKATWFGSLYSILLFAYPFTYLLGAVYSVGYVFGGAYFAVLTILLGLMLVGLKSLDIYGVRRSAVVLLLGFMILAVTIVPRYRLNYWSFFAWMVITVTTAHKSTVNRQTVIRIATVFFYGYLLISALLLVHPARYSAVGRFSGLVPSASVHSVYLLLSFGFFLSQGSRKGSIFSLLQVLYTQSRTAVVGAAIMLVVRWAGFCRFDRFSKIVSVATFSLFLVGYPAFRVLQDQGVGLTTLGRYEESAEDSSSRLRFGLVANLISELERSNTLELLIGHGGGQARLQTLEAFARDIQVHNDYLVVLYDFGLLIALILFGVMLKAMNDNYLSFCLTVAYLVGFYHNMLLDRFLFGAVILIGSTSTPSQRRCLR